MALITAHHFFKPNLDPGEKILFVFHRHPFVMLGDILRLSFTGIFVPLFFYYLFPEVGLFFILWMIMTGIRLFYVVATWYHDALLITTVSLIKVDWHGFFHRSSSRLEYPKIDGLSYTIKGFRRTIFHYGDVSVGQINGGSALTIKDCMNPSKVERVVLSHQENFVSDQSLKDASTLKDLLTTMLRHHAKTKGVPSSKKETATE